MVVVDTSVALKWFFPEEGTDRAKALLGSVEMAAPDLLIYEFSNVLACRRQQTGRDIARCLETLYRFDIQFFFLPQNRFQRVLQLARQFDLSGYDASFVALAEALNVDLVTADAKLVQKTKSLSFVKLLSAFLPRAE